MDFIRGVFEKHRHILSYLFFGILTTFVNFLVYFPLYNWFCWPASISNVIAWIFAVAVAFLTNKPFVFHSNDWSAPTVISELSRFVTCRIGSGLFETLAIWVFVDLCSFNGNWIKIALSILVVILNYITSRCLVFAKKERG